MTTRLIEDCFDGEVLEEKKYNKYISISIPTNRTLIIVDPSMIHIRDLMNAKPGKVSLVRVRRPGWGVGNLHKFIYKIEILSENFKT